MSIVYIYEKGRLYSKAFYKNKDSLSLSLSLSPITIVIHYLQAMESYTKNTNPEITHGQRINIVKLINL